MTLEVSPELLETLIDKAAEAKELAYCPYSRFQVGAAVLTADGSIITGCNVENASYGLTMCAERIAVMKAVSCGHHKFKTIVISTNLTDKFKFSCGACLQVMIEFGKDWEIITVKPDRTWEKKKLLDLLPHPFCPDDLNKTK